jgi:hypothetical protein
MKRFYLITTLFLSFISSFAQDYNGYRVGNYTGVNGVFFNPANIADSRYRFDFNLFSLNTFAGNNQASFNAKKITQTFDTDSLQNQIFGKNAGSASGMISMDVHGLSLMFNAGKKTAVALTTRARVMSNIVDFDGRLVDKVISDINTDANLPYSISSRNNMRVNVNAWTELGLSVGQVLADRDQHFLKAGVTLKYLAGVANGYMNISNLNTTINQDQTIMEPYLSNTTGTLGLGFGGVRISDFDASEFSSVQSSGFGGDIGFVYEFRPDFEDYRLQSDNWRRDMNKYKMKISVALLDIGGISYQKDMKRSAAYSMNITGNERFYLRELENTDLDDYKDTLNSKPQFFTPDNSNNQTSYFVSLPTTLQLDLDYHLQKGFYINIGTQLALSDSRSKPYNSHYYHSFTVTPRFEGRGLGIYVPVNYNELTSFNAGLSFRLGPLFVGSGSIITALLGDSKQADFHFGLRFGGLQKNKANKEKKNDKDMQDDYRRTQGR